MKRKPEVGESVKLTADFLRNTGQFLGGEGRSRWSIAACECGLCRLGNHVAVNAPNLDGDGLRHFNFHNLQPARMPG